MVHLYNYYTFVIVDYIKNMFRLFSWYIKIFSFYLCYIKHIFLHIMDILN
jgi:hypothetical protein